MREQDLHGKIVGTKTEDWSRTILQAPGQQKPKSQKAYLLLSFEDVSMDPGALTPEAYVQETL